MDSLISNAPGLTREQCVWLEERIQAGIEGAVNEERERCAEVALRVGRPLHYGAAQEIERAIRARKNA